MLSRLTVVMALAVAFGLPGCETKKPSGPGTTTTTETPTAITLLPALASLTLGASVQFTATVAGSTNQGVTWSTSGVSVATVSSSGLVTCVGIGLTEVTATSVVAPTLKASALIACASAFSVSVTELSFIHTIGSSPCPQAIGTIRVRTESAQAQTFTVVGHTALSVDAGSASFSLAPGAFRDVALSFNCTTQTSFNATVTISNGAESRQVAVSGVIR